MSATQGLRWVHVANAERRVSPARVATPAQGNGSRLVFLTKPNGLAAEQYKILRRRLCNLHPLGGAILVTSPGAGEGKTLTATNLAWCLAEAGHQTCLVDLDLRAPGVCRALGLEAPEDGVEDVLSGQQTVNQAVRQIGDRSLYLLGIRERRVSPGKLLSSAYIWPLMSELRAMFQWVIVDFAPLIPMADVGEVLPRVDGAIMVVRPGKTGKAMIAPALEILGSKVWGVVVTDTPIKGGEYYGSYGKQRE